jgi:hypothetical protein
MRESLSSRLDREGTRCPGATTANISSYSCLLTRYAHLDSALILAVWAVYVYVSRRAYRDLAGAFVECDCLQLELLVNVDGLEDMVRSVENDERIAG